MSRDGTIAAPDLSPPEIPRPSAIGGNWRRFWEPVWITATQDFKRRYAHSALGYIWTLLSPMLLFAAIYLVVLQIKVRFNNQVVDYGALLFTNIVLFQFYVQGSNRAIRSLVRNSNLLTKMSIPRMVMPLSAVLCVLFTLCMNLIVVFVWVLLWPIHPMWTWLLLPVIVSALVLITSAVGLLLSTIYVRYRDVGEIYPLIARCLFYTSPVIIPIGLMPKPLFDAQSFNPIAPIIVQVRPWLIDPNAPGWFELGKSLWWEVMPFIIFAAICVAGWVVFTRKSRRVAEEV